MAFSGAKLGKFQYFNKLHLNNVSGEVLNSNLFRNKRGIKAG